MLRGMGNSGREAHNNLSIRKGNGKGLSGATVLNVAVPFATFTLLQANTRGEGKGVHSDRFRRYLPADRIICFIVGAQIIRDIPVGESYIYPVGAHV
jgi:hypothetical protein